MANSGFIVTPDFGPSVAVSFLLSTANDFDGDDLIEGEILGTNGEGVPQATGPDGILGRTPNFSSLRMRCRWS